MLLDVLDEVFEILDWAPSQSPKALSRVKRFINRIRTNVLKKAPYFQKHGNIVLRAPTELEPLGATDTISAIDQWVLRLDLVDGNALATAWQGGGVHTTHMIWVKDPLNRDFIAILSFRAMLANLIYFGGVLLLVDAHESVPNEKIWHVG